MQTQYGSRRPGVAGEPKTRPMTTSSLAQQLKSIQQQDRLVRGVPAGQKKRPSFLFDEKEAADYDDESIYELGVEGFQDLCKVDPSLRSYQECIFSEDLMAKDLSLLTKGEKKELDKEVSAFLTLLSPHLQLKATHKVLEWMVRKWRVNECNVDALLACILPHHDTIPFVRMVQIVYFTNDSRWSFLFDKVKQGGSAITRRLLAQRCTVDSSILGRIIHAYGYFKEHERLHSGYTYGSMYVSFVTFLMLEVVACTYRFTETETILFYQRLEVLAREDASEETLIGTMMVFMEFCERAPLSRAAILYFLRKIIRLCTPAVEKHVILTVARTVEAQFAIEIEEATALAVARLTLSHWNDDLATYRPTRFLAALADALGRVGDSESSALIPKIMALSSQ